MRYLIVDDDRLCRELLRDMLAPHGHCDLAGSGSEAITAIRQALDNGTPYDLVCLDILMPAVDGHEVLQKIRHLESEYGIYGSSGVKVIMTTALKDSKHCVRSFAEGCENYVTKPVEEASLLAAVRDLLKDAWDVAHRGARIAGGGTAPRHGVGPSEPQAGPAPTSRSARFLVVDDDPVSRDLLRNILSRYGHCHTVFNGTEALGAVRLSLEDNLPYDLICLDIVMPRMDGHEVLQAIRQIELEYGIRGLAGAKVIMTTALADSKHCLRAFREGCESYTTKPLDPADLLDKMRQLGLAVPEVPEVVA